MKPEYEKFYLTTKTLYDFTKKFIDAFRPMMPAYLNLEKVYNEIIDELTLENKYACRMQTIIHLLVGGHGNVWLIISCITDQDLEDFKKACEEETFILPKAL